MRKMIFWGIAICLGIVILAVRMIGSDDLPNVSHRTPCSAPGSLDTSLSHAAGLIEIAACHA